MPLRVGFPASMGSLPALEATASCFTLPHFTSTPANCWVSDLHLNPFFPHPDFAFLLRETRKETDGIGRAGEWGLAMDKWGSPSVETKQTSPKK